jgi:hypothetical protein
MPLAPSRIKFRRRADQTKLFYEFRLDDRIPQGHLLRRIDVVITAALTDLHKELAPHYSTIGRPSVDPSEIWRKTSLSRKRPSLLAESVEWCGISSSRSSLQNQR